MPIEKPTKPTNLVPRTFGGEKNNFSEDLQATGFEANIPQTYNGDNINYQLDATGKELDYVEKVVDFINNTPVNHVLFVNQNNQLDYADKEEIGLGLKGKITNCITEIPQRIKLELNDGILTLKAGSISTVPYGTEDLTGQYPVGSTFLNDNFKVYETQFANGKFFVWAEVQSDMECIVATSDMTAKCFIDFASNTFRGNALNDVSGDVAPANRAWWYDTANNTLGYWIETSQTFVRSNCSFPLSIATSVSQKFTSIDQIFNGMGYIGKRFWLDKDVKMLISDGRNDNGTLKNKEITLNNIAFGDAYSASSGYRYNAYYPSSNGINNIFAQNTLQGLKIDRPTGIQTLYSRWYYATDENKWYYASLGGDWQQIDLIILNSYYWDGDNQFVSEYKQEKYTFKALDYNDKSEVSGWAMPSNKYIDLEVGAHGSEYTAPDNGYFSIKGTASSANLAQVALWRPDGVSFGTRSYVYSEGAGPCVILPAKKGDIVGISIHNVKDVILRFFYAEGEV